MSEWCHHFNSVWCSGGFTTQFIGLFLSSSSSLGWFADVKLRKLKMNEIRRMVVLVRRSQQVPFFPFFSINAEGWGWIPSTLLDVVASSLKSIYVCSFSLNMRHFHFHCVGVCFIICVLQFGCSKFSLEHLLILTSVSVEISCVCVLNFPFSLF